MRLDRKIAKVFRPLIDPARYKGAYGGRGSAKSHDRAEALIEACATRKVSAVCVREVQKSLKDSVKKLLENKIETLGLGPMFEVQESLIKSKTGSIIIFQGMSTSTAESIKSLEGFDIAWVEEAQSLSQRSLDLLRPTIRKPGSELWFTWNPGQETDPIDILLRGDNPPPDSIVVKSNYKDNPWFPDVLRAEMEYDKQRDIDKYLHVWEGEYLSMSNARVFHNWSIEEFDSPSDGVYRLGADWGFSVDPSVLIRSRLEGKRLYIDYEAHMVGCEIDMLPDLFDQVPGARRWPITADSARPETISYMRKHGYPLISPAIKGKDSVEEGIEFLTSYDIVVHPRCENTIYELKNYKYKVDPLTENVLPILEDKDNHVIDALRYACEGARKSIKVQRQIVMPKVIIPSTWMGS